jgi:hypothetical protein
MPVVAKPFGYGDYGDPALFVGLVWIWVESSMTYISQSHVLVCLGYSLPAKEPK